MRFPDIVTAYNFASAYIGPNRTDVIWHNNICTICESYNNALQLWPIATTPTLQLLIGIGINIPEWIATMYCPNGYNTIIYRSLPQQEPEESQDTNTIDIDDYSAAITTPPLYPTQTPTHVEPIDLLLLVYPPLEDIYEDS